MWVDVTCLDCSCCGLEVELAVNLAEHLCLGSGSLLSFFLFLLLDALLLLSHFLTSALDAFTLTLSRLEIVDSLVSLRAEDLDECFISTVVINDNLDITTKASSIVTSRFN